MKQIKGGLCIEQLKKQAKKFSDFIDAPASINVDFWHHPGHGFSVKFKIWDSKKAKFYEPFGKHNDLRKISALIDQIIQDEKEVDKCINSK